MPKHIESAPELVRRLWGEYKDISSCWNWPRSCTRAGYGQISRKIDGSQRLLYAHRVAYEIANGSIPKGMEVRHKCDNPACFNPNHLCIGTHAQNMHDMATRRRSKIGRRYPLGDAHWTRKYPDRVRRGEHNNKARLTAGDVMLIRKSCSSHAELARLYGVSDTCINAVRKMVSWKHLS